MVVDDRICELCAKIAKAQGDEYHRLVAELNKVFEQLEEAKKKKKGDGKRNAA